MKKVLLPIILLLSITGNTFAQTIVPAPVAPPAVSCSAPNYSPLLQSILASQKQLLDTQTQLLTVEKNTNTQVTLMNKTFGQTMGSIGVWVSKYVAPAVVAYLAAKKL